MPLQLLLPSSYYLYLSKKTSCYLTPWTTQQTLRTAKEQEIECNAVAWESIKQLLTFPSESTSRSLGGHGGLGEAWPTPSAAIYSVGPRRPPACLSCVCVSWEKLGSKQGRKAYVSPKGRGSWELKPSKEKGSLLLCWARRERERERRGRAVCRGRRGKRKGGSKWAMAVSYFFCFFLESAQRSLLIVTATATRAPTHIRILVYSSSLISIFFFFLNSLLSLQVGHGTC